MSERKTYFVDVILPLPVKNTFTYRVPFELNEQIQKGVRVVVPFGRAKHYSAIVSQVHEQIPEGYQAKYIDTILDDYPIVTQDQLKLWNWISKYYMSSIGEVMNVALPSNLKLASETKIALHPDFVSQGNISNHEHFETIIDALEVNEVLDIKEVSSLLKIKTVQPIIKKMMDQKIIISTEELNYKYTDKTASFVFLEEEYQDAEKLADLIDELNSKKAKAKQAEALLKFLSLSDADLLSMPIAKKDLEEAEISSSSINSLARNGIFKIEKLKIDRFQLQDDAEISDYPTLSEAQNKAYHEIDNAFKEDKITLLYGITGSGKTEIYIHLIQQAIEQGKQVLYLLPEIALTAQLIKRLKKYFGDLVGVYHSKFNQNERVEIWNHVLQNDPNQFRIIIGARSSVFLPFRDLGLIIVDEEHESSFKQYEPAPRYNARDMAIVLGQLFKASCLLGSATPSLESYYNAKTEKYALVKLKERYGTARLPLIYCADIQKERKQKSMTSHFSKLLIDAMSESLKEKKQIILFQNRRGYTPIWSCEVCNWAPKCINCDVSLTYHKHTNQLKCHYCGYTAAPMGSCKNCGSNRLNMLGFGTEKIEDELGVIFPNAVVKRMDLDSTRSKNSYEKIIEDFENHQTDILVGTQMVTKGLDFENVNLVGILDADLLLNRPDFRAFERSYQLMSQVAGRAGRKDTKGKVIIQTGQPDHWIIRKVIDSDYEDFYKDEIIERERFLYPPFYKLITLTFKNKDINSLDAGAAYVSNELKTVFGNRILGPEYALIKRINNFWIKQVTIKFEKNLSPQKVKEKIEEIIDQMYAQPIFKTNRVSIDVDPM